jgi:phosphoglycolate phosphatase-like HAD superfamily hydrolase
MEIFRKVNPDLPLPSFSEWKANYGNTNFLEFFYERGVSRSITIEFVREIWIPHYEKSARSKKTIVRNGVKEVLKFCHDRGIVNIILSSSIDDVRGYLANSGLIDFFTEIQTRVPDKDAAIKNIVDKHGIDPREAFYVDDTFDGISHAKANGLVTFGVLSGCNDEARIHAAKPHHPVNSFLEIFEILQNS